MPEGRAGPPSGPASSHIKVSKVSPQAAAHKQQQALGRERVGAGPFSNARMFGQAFRGIRQEAAVRAVVCSGMDGAGKGDYVHVYVAPMMFSFGGLSWINGCWVAIVGFGGFGGKVSASRSSGRTWLCTEPGGVSMQLGAHSRQHIITK